MAVVVVVVVAVVVVVVVVMVVIHGWMDKIFCKWPLFGLVAPVFSRNDIKKLHF